MTTSETPHDPPEDQDNGEQDNGEETTPIASIGRPDPHLAEGASGKSLADDDEDQIGRGDPHLT